MRLQAFSDQLMRDLKASWQKTALLMVLLLVGLCFWLPPLFRLMSGGTGPTPTVAVVATPTVSVASPVSAAAPAAVSAAPSVPEWQQRVAVLESDPLVQSVEVSAFRGNPFQLDWNQFSPPVLFEDDRDSDVETRRRTASAAPARLPSGLVLKSTIIGLNKRAALINSRLYHEGREVNINGDVYLLKAVMPRKVVLSRGDNVFELEIPRGIDNGNFELQSAGP